MASPLEHGHLRRFAGRTTPGERESRGRLLIALLAIQFLVLVARLFYLQVAQYHHYLTLSDVNRIRVVTIEPPRGRVYDRNGQALVDNRLAYTLSVIPSQLKDNDAAIARLHELVRFDPVAVKRRIREQRARPYEPVRVRRDAGFDVISTIEERRADFPGVIYQLEARRRYIHDEWGAHIFGYVREMSAEQYAQLREWGYLFGEFIGQGGIEQAYEDLLHGEPGVQYLQVDARGRDLGPVPERQAKEPRAGNNLHLTLDWELQAAAEAAFPSDRAGSVVALDPRTGEVLLLVSRPNFDLNRFAGVLSDELWQAVRSDTLHPLINRALQGLYPPGSTFKMLTAISAFAHEGSDPMKRVLCRGQLTFGNRTFKCWKEGGHGRLGLYRALVESCDVFFYRLGARLDLAAWADVAETFGFGHPTQMGLPGEAAGLFPTPAYYAGPEGSGPWSAGMGLNLAIGQGEILVTPIQMAVFTATLARGHRITPYLVAREEYDGWEKPLTHAPPVALDDYLTPAVSKRLREAMRGVVSDNLGTGRRARVRGLTVGGKTGTSQNPHGDDHAWFIAFAPFEAPTIAVAAVVENAGHGGAVAAPIVREILEAYLAKSGGLARGGIETESGGAL